MIGILSGAVRRRAIYPAGVLMKAMGTQAPSANGKLSGKVAVVTASTDGIGLAIARRLAEDGANVVVSSRKKENVDRTVADLSGAGYAVLGVPCHVSKDDDRKNLITKAVEKFGGIDIFVSNAATNPTVGTILECSEKVWDKIFEVNVKNALQLTQLVVPHLQQRKGGVIVYVASIAGYQPMPLLGPYSVSKTALLGLTKAVAQQVASDNIRVNCVAPGIVKTKFSSFLVQNPAILEKTTETVPMGRVAEPHEMAGLVSFLCSDDSSYITVSLFSVVRFKNSECVGEGGLTGICYTNQDCSIGGGTSSGDCADGFGVCCVTRVGCGETSSNNCSYVESPGYPSTFDYPLTCTHTVTFAPDVCQIRMDVERVELTPPTNAGNCEDDTLTFSQDRKWTSVCGTTTASHFYLDVDPSVSSSLTLTFITSSTTFPRRWRIKLCQIGCDQLSMAPTGCGQYYTTASGSIKGWNHEGIYLSGQNYAICVRKELDHCSTTYLDNQQFMFMPMCGDTFEYPFPVISNPSRSVACNTAITLISAMPLTMPLEGPHYFYLTTTTDTTNDHSSSFNLNYLFTQNPC